MARLLHVSHASLFNSSAASNESLLGPHTVQCLLQCPLCMSREINLLHGQAWRLHTANSSSPTPTTLPSQLLYTHRKTYDDDTRSQQVQLQSATAEPAVLNHTGPL